MYMYIYLYTYMYMYMYIYLSIYLHAHHAHGEVIPPRHVQIKHVHTVEQLLCHLGADPN